MNVLTSIFVLGFLIFFHEAGHFLAATFQGIKVSGFSIGFGPAILKKEFRGVTFSLRALPLGGFVSFPDDESKVDSDDPNLMRNRPIPQRAIVISAGVIANLLLAWLVLAGQATFIGLPSQPDPGVLVVATKQNEAAEISGLVAGDNIIEVNGIELGIGPDAVKVLVDQIQKSPGKVISFKRIQENKVDLIEIQPTEFSGKGRIGAQLQQNVSGELVPAESIYQVINQTDRQFIDILSKTISGYKGLFTDFNTTAKQMSGPVKIIEIGAQLSQQGSTGLFLFAALVSINLAVLNSLPLPLLDGGQLSLLLIEGFRGKPVPEKFQLAFMQSGFLLLVGLSVVLIIRDTSQLAIFQQIINH